MTRKRTRSRSLTPKEGIKQVREMIQSKLPALLNQCGIPSDPNNRFEFLDTLKHSDLTPKLSVLCEPIINHTNNEVSDEGWYPQHERIDFHADAGHTPIILRDHEYLPQLRALRSPKLIAFGINFLFGYSTLSVSLADTGISTLCDAPGGLSSDKCIRIHSSRRKVHCDPYPLMKITNSTRGLKRLQAWVEAALRCAIDAHIHSAGDHRRGVLSILKAETEAQELFEDTVNEIRRSYKRRFPNRSLHYTQIDVTIKRGRFQKLHLLYNAEERAPRYCDFQYTQRLNFCLDLSRQIWLTMQPGAKKSILTASNYQLSIVSLRARYGNLQTMQRADALIASLSRTNVFRERTGRVKGRQTVLVQSKSPATT